jgi:hypothetical protein
MSSKHTTDYRRREARKRASGELPPDNCTTPGCYNKREHPYKKCRKCLDYHREYKRRYRKKQEKRPGTCSKADCNHPTDGEHKLCTRCRRQIRERQRNNPGYARKHKAMRARVKAEALDYYGRVCQCCGEEHEEFLTLDHIDGGGARHTTPSGKTRYRGPQLYAWLKRNGWPDGFRTLCHTCNFTLGHFGYCPHSDLTQRTNTGRPPKGYRPSKEDREKRAARHRRLKLEVMNAYGGPKCSCPGCTEDNLGCLSIDHLGSGADHREEVNGDRRDGRNLYSWLKRHDFPPGYRVLCHNCNFAHGHLGYCPHQD